MAIIRGQSGHFFPSLQGLGLPQSAINANWELCQMGAKREARKQFEKEQELEKLRGKKERNQETIRLAQELKAAKIAAMTPEEKDVSFRKQAKRRKIALVITLVAAVFFVISIFSGGSNNTSESSSSSSTSTRSYPVEYVRSAVVNPATLSVVFKVTNDGTQPVTPECTIRMQDASGAYKGFDIFELIDPISASASKQVIVQLTITKEGAEYANQFSGECTATTSDSGTNAGNDVKISDIQNFSATDSSEGWYWGASFKANAAPMTQMDCVVKALNASGKVVATTSYRGNTLNDGTVIGYGSDAQSLVDSTKSIVQSIKSFDVKCNL